MLTMAHHGKRMPRECGKMFFKLFIFVCILYLEITVVLLKVLDDIKIVPRVNHLPQLLLPRILGIRVNPANLRCRKGSHFVHHLVLSETLPVYTRYHDRTPNDKKRLRSSIWATNHFPPTYLATSISANGSIELSRITR